MIESAKIEFTKIYDERQWDSGGTRDGWGSSLSFTTDIRESLPRLFINYDIRTLLDASCGEFHWQRELDLTGIHYIGCDIVAEKIEILRTEFPMHEWKHLDIISESLPSADLWLCRDTLFHFPYEHIFSAFRNFIRSDIRYLLTSSQTSGHNRDLERFGDYFPLNLLLEPFNLPDPLDRFQDKDRELFLYDKKILAEVSWLKDY
jgi:hypothetical protein